MEELNEQKRRKKPYKELIINGIYKDWKSFYEPNKEEIYKSIIEIFEEFKNTRKKSLVLRLSAKFKNADWNTEFEFHRSETIVLKSRPINDVIKEFINEKILPKTSLQPINNLTVKKQSGYENVEEQQPSSSKQNTKRLINGSKQRGKRRNKTNKSK